MNENKILSLLGLCRRAGKLTVGNDAAYTSIVGGKSKLIIYPRDISQNTLSKFLRRTEDFDVPCVKLNSTKDEVSHALGKLCAVASVEDSGFAKKLLGYVQSDLEE